MQDTLVDIIMPTYNSCKYLSTQLDSILQQSHKNINLIISDDASTDNTVKILEDYSKKYPNKIEIYKNQNNLGIKKNIAFLLSKTKAEYIMFADHDDFWLEDKVELSLKEAKKLEEEKPNSAILIFTDKIVTDENLNTTAISHSKAAGFNTKKLDLKHILRKNVASGCTMLINRRLLDIAKVSDDFFIPEEAIMHDYWFIILACAFGEVKYIDKPTMLYRQHNANTMGAGKKIILSILNNLKQKRLMSFINISMSKKVTQANKFYDIYKARLLENGKDKFFKPYIKLQKRKSLLGYLKLFLIK